MYRSGQTVPLFIPQPVEHGQIYSSAEAAQLRPNKKPMYQSGQTVPLFILQFVEHVQTYSSAGSRPTEAE